jgi:ribosomal protein S18 acetylase RimI-like enzyme
MSSLLKTKEAVVLYVAHDNQAAAKVYHRVGFVGLDGKDYSAEGVEPWLEIGFDRDVVELGHW